MELKKKLLDRRNQVWIIFSLVFIILGLRLAYVTITQGEYYREMSINKRLKQLTTVAKRGEIRDRNGKLLAGNLPSFTINVSGSTISKDELTQVSIDLLDILSERQEAHIEFPIRVDEGTFYYIYDQNIEKWLTQYGYEGYNDAVDLFAEIRRREQIPVVLTEAEAIRLLKLKGVYLPFSVSSMKFYSQIEKERFLEAYGIPQDTLAEEAFRIIRDRREFKIPDEMSDEDAYKVLALKHDFKIKGYRKYVPIRVAEDVSEETAVLISEMTLSLPGVSVDIEPKRFYPYADTASHILGYMGKIATENEINTYVKGYGYDRNQLIGKVGLEGQYELALNGEDGLKYIEVDALGKLVREVPKEELEFLDESQPRDAISGEDIQLTIDIDLQKRVEDYLAYGLEKIQEGGVYESQWGDYTYKESFPKAETGAAVVVNVKNGEVIAMASHPDYDLNLFATGISSKDWNALQPENKRNPLAPRPLYNLATLTSVQPGSTYKPITGYAALRQGLDPAKKIFADGFVEIGAHRFGCWLWNNYSAKHGKIDLYTALAVSCNYYFFDISTGYNWYLEKPLDFVMNTDLLLEYSKVFGLDEQTGIEIYESVQGIPDPDKKKRQLESALKRTLVRQLPDYFPEGHFQDEDAIAITAEEIVSWSDENPSRGRIISRLREMGITTYTEAEPLADLIKYSYFNQMEWAEGDTLNLSIGQGGHQYTPIQMARYIATIANDGYLNELSLVKQVGEEPVRKNENVTNDGISDNDELAHVRKGMLMATEAESGGTAKIMEVLPMEIAAKTGTAEKEGRIPPADEIQYFKDNLSQIDPALNVDLVETEAQRILQKRTNELANLQRQLSRAQSAEEQDKLDRKISSQVRKGYLTEVSAFRQAIKDLSALEISDDDLDAFRETYDNYAWFVSFGPYEDPEIAVVIMVPQGGHGGYAAPIAREIYADYFNLVPESEEEEGSGDN